MKLIATIVVSVAMAALTAGPALADPGTPGTTFPEQPGGNVQTACAAILSSAAPSAPMSPTAQAITGGLVSDACFGV